MTRPLLMDGFDDCIIGIVEIAPSTRVVCYDRERVVEQLITEHDMTSEEAWDYHGFNQSCAYVGEGTPAFLDKHTADQVLTILEIEDD